MEEVKGPFRGEGRGMEHGQEGNGSCGVGGGCRGFGSLGTTDSKICAVYWVALLAVALFSGGAPAAEVSLSCFDANVCVFNMGAQTLTLQRLLSKS